jgi:hypothetical protein
MCHSSHHGPRTEGPMVLPCYYLVRSSKALRVICYGFDRGSVAVLIIIAPGEVKKWRWRIQKAK